MHVRVGLDEAIFSGLMVYSGVVWSTVACSSVDRVETGVAGLSDSVEVLRILRSRFEHQRCLVVRGVHGSCLYLLAVHACS